MFAAFGGYGGRVQLEFDGVEDNGFDGFLDLDVDIDLALVRPWFFRLKVEEGYGVVGGFDAVLTLAMSLLHEVMAIFYSSGRISRSEAILTNVLEASLEQCLNCLVLSS